MAYPPVVDLRLSGPQVDLRIGSERAAFLLEVLRLCGALDECVAPPGEASEASSSPVSGLMPAYKLTGGGDISADECQILADGLDESVSLTRERLRLDERESGLMDFLARIARLCRDSKLSGGLVARAHRQMDHRE